MIYLDRKGNREIVRCYVYYIDGFDIEWRQSVNRKEEVVGIGFFNWSKYIYKYKKKGFGNCMKRRIVNLSRNRKHEKII